MNDDTADTAPRLGGFDAGTPLYSAMKSALESLRDESDDVQLREICAGVLDGRVSTHELARSEGFGRLFMQGAEQYSARIESMTSDERAELDLAAREYLDEC